MVVQHMWAEMRGIGLFISPIVQGCLWGRVWVVAYLIDWWSCSAGMAAGCVRGGGEQGEVQGEVRRFVAGLCAG
jgi:hypothetical protein